MRRLWKALRHETPAAAATAERLGIAADGRDRGAGDQDLSSAAYRQAVAGARVARAGQRGHEPQRHPRRRRVAAARARTHEKLASARPARSSALARMEDDRHRRGADPVGQGRPSCRGPSVPQPVFGLAIAAEKRSDDVKLTGAIGKLIEEDPTLELEQNADTAGDGAVGPGRHPSPDRDRPAAQPSTISRSTARRPQVPYKETIRSGTPAAFALQAAERRPRPVRRHPDRGEAAAARHRASPSSTAWSAAPSRATTSPRSRKG